MTGRYVHLAHLRQASTLVRIGDRVQAGQQEARVGNSGNGDEPHLDLQVQDSARPDVHHAGVHSFPILLRGIELTRGWAYLLADLRRGDWLAAG